MLLASLPTVQATHRPGKAPRRQRPPRSRVESLVALDSLPDVMRPQKLRVVSPCAPAALTDDEGSPKSVTELAVDHIPSLCLPLPTSQVSPCASGALKPTHAPRPFSAANVNSIVARLKRQRANLADVDELVPRERHPLNRGKRPCRHTGLPGKLYDVHDIVSPIVDSMRLMHHRLGWHPMGVDEEHPLVLAPPPGAFTYTNTGGGGGMLRRSSTSEADRLHALGIGPAPAAPKAALCSGCSNSDEKKFTLTKDKQHVCGDCGVVSSSLRISTHREKACTEDEDKTTHADKPWDAKTDKFDHPALSCMEVRQQREREVSGTRISKKAKAKFGLGWTHEHAAREAAKAELERSEMDTKDLTKGQHIQISLDQLFTPLEPLDNRVKRFCRMEADRAWRGAVRHAKVCKRMGKCPLRFKEKGHAVIADAVLSCSLDALIEGSVQIDGVTHSALMVTANKLGAQQVHKGVPCALRGLRTVVATFLSHTGSEPVPSCPSPKAPVKPVALGNLSPANPSPAGVPSPAASSSGASSSNMPFARVDSSASDFGEPASRLMQLRDAITLVFKALGTANSSRTRDRTFAAVQDAAFRASLDIALENDDDVRVLSIEGLAYCLLAAVAQQTDPFAAARERRTTPATLLASFGVPLQRLEAVTASLSALLPPCLSAAEPDADDLLFG